MDEQIINQTVTPPQSTPIAVNTLQNIEDIEILGIKVYKKSPDHFLKSEVLGIPIYQVGLGILLFKYFKKHF